MLTISPITTAQVPQKQKFTSNALHQPENRFAGNVDSFQKTLKSALHFAGGLEDVVGMTKEKTLIQEQFIGPFRDSIDPNYVNHTNVVGQNAGGLLLHGPAGTGKTYLAQKTAEELQKLDPNVKIVEILPEDRADHLVGMTEKVLADKFSEAAQASRSIVFIDEFDSLASKYNANSGTNNNHQANIRAAMLMLLQNAPEQGITVIGASNIHPKELDPAIVRAGRMTVKREIKEIDQKTREGIFKMSIQKALTQNARFPFSDRQLEKLAKDAADRSPADIVSIVKLAANKACSKRENLSIEHLEAIMRDEFDLTIAPTPPTLTREEAIDKAISELGGSSQSMREILKNPFVQSFYLATLGMKDKRK